MDPICPLSIRSVMIYFLIIFGSLPINTNSRALNGQSVSELCKEVSNTEYFRLPNEKQCREVVRCSPLGLITLRCPIGMAFDVDRQVCDLVRDIENCGHHESKQARNSRSMDSWRIIKELTKKSGNENLMDQSYSKRDVLDPFQGHTFGKRSIVTEIPDRIQTDEFFPSR
ncbi:uncharacterized protein LOC141856756 [Brevipalpus obovatus]|uniref:uncharacterized protein LOC141856756 n=1 Tax=Brevipalpus obovatus TaxID=246614 RepID=UPI003D9EE4E5